MELRSIEYADALYVAENMREMDRREIFATRWNDDPAELARECAVFGRFGWTALHEGRPVAIVGAIPTHPGVWSVFMFATDDFRHISFSLTKFVRRVMIPALVAAGAHRAECASLSEHEQAHRWLELLGARQEGAPMLAFGRNRENFVRFVWSREDALLS